jgi:hypothetical protein
MWFAVGEEQEAHIFELELEIVELLDWVSQRLRLRLMRNCEIRSGAFT